LKFGFGVLGKFRIYWNLVTRTPITSSCEITLYPRDLRFKLEKIID
jgi:hypothetical protein